MNLFRNNNKSIAIIILFTILITLLFIDKPFHIDDLYVISIAQQLSQKPLDPYGFEIDNLNSRVNALWYTDPPLVSYYMSFLLHFFGDSEKIIHFGFILFPLLAAISMFYFSRRFVNIPLFTTLLMIATPTFIVSSHSVMQDLPLLSISLLAILFHVKGVDQNKSKFLVLASIVAGLVFMTKYNGVILIFLMTLYSILQQKYNSLKYLTITAVMILSFFLHNLYYYGIVHFLDSLVPWLVSGKGISAGVIPWLKTTAILFISNLSYIGGAIVFSPFLIWPFVRHKSNLKALTAYSMATFILTLILSILSKNFVSGQYTVIQLFLFFVFVTSGLLIIHIFLTDNFKIIKKLFRSLYNFKLRILSFKERKIIFLIIWFLVVFIFNFTFAGGSVRYNTMLLPPFVILFIISLKRLKLPKNISTLFWIIFTSTLLLGLALGYADYQYAETYRQISTITNKSEYGQIFFLGHEGFKYYMEKQGAIFLTSYEGKIKKGDMIIRAPLASPSVLSQSVLDNLVKVGTLEFNTNFPLRTLNSEAHAGWYKYGAGFLPYSLSNAPLEKFEIYTVREDFEK